MLEEFYLVYTSKKSKVFTNSFEEAQAIYKRDFPWEKAVPDWFPKIKLYEIFNM